MKKTLRNLLFPEKEPSEWYLTRGLLSTDILGVWQPKGAIDLATSYNSLIGDKVLTTTSAPTWNSTDGWIFDGLSQYLKLSNVELTDDTSIAIRFSTINYAKSIEKFLFYGLIAIGEVSYFMRLFVWKDVDETDYLESSFSNSYSAADSSGIQTGVAIITATGLYINGILAGEYVFGESFPSPIIELFIGAQSAIAGFSDQKIQAVSIYNKKLSAPQIALISAKMALL